MRTHIPPSLDERVIDRLHPRDPKTREAIIDEDIAALAKAVGSARKSAEQLEELRDALEADVTRTPEAVALEVRRAALKLGEQGAQALDVAVEAIEKKVAVISRETMAPPPPRDAVELSIETELRAALSRMGAPDRRAVIDKALDEGDDRIVGSVLRAPGLLSGVSAEQQTNLRVRYRQKRYPEKFARLQRLEKGCSEARRLGDYFVNYIREIAETPRARAAEAAASGAERALATVSKS